MSSITSFCVSPHFANFIQDWDYKTYLTIGGYGSGKSYNNALKIHLKLMQEKRTCLVVRNVFETIKESCFAVFKEIISNMGYLQGDEYKRKTSTEKIVAVMSPMEIRYPNGSRIIFRGLDNVDKIKSIHGVSIVWIEECSEITQDAFIELLGRVRSPGNTLHFLLSCNPVGVENWVYNYFFIRRNDDGSEMVLLDPNRLYDKRVMIVAREGTSVYYHHSVVDDNPFINHSYIDTLDNIKSIDKQRWLVSRWGRFGVVGRIVLPNFTVARDAQGFKNKVNSISARHHYFGLDLGFEESYNALLSCCVDVKENVLYIYDEIYMNNITDDLFARRDDVKAVMARARKCQKSICCDSAEPKAIKYYRQVGYDMVKCRKYPGSRLDNTKKMKRFKKIVCSPKCKNTIRELSALTYKKDNHGNLIYDEFNVDAHTFKVA